MEIERLEVGQLSQLIANAVALGYEVGCRDESRNKDFLRPDLAFVKDENTNKLKSIKVRINLEDEKEEEVITSDFLEIMGLDE